MQVKNVEMEIRTFGGLNTAKSFSEIDLTQSPKMLNFIPRKTGGIANRDGSIPLTPAALGNAIKVICSLRKAGVNNLLVTAGTTLYKLIAGVLTAQTMTNALNTAIIGHAQFRDATAAEVTVIADGANLKSYDGTTVVNITPAADDGGVLPTNVLTTINSTKPAIGVTLHNNRLVVWGANSDTIFNSKIGYFDYFESTSFQRFVKENDYVVQCISYAGALLILMRRHVAVRFGDGYTDPPTSADWSQDFIDTNDGCMNANSVALVVYPDEREEIFYQSDRGVHAIFTINTLSLDSSARYSTRSVTKNLINFDDLGVTKAEWAAAAGWFYDGRYWLVYKKAGVTQGMVFDTINQEWYPISGVQANCFFHDEDYFYYAGDDGLLKVFNIDLYSDWSDTAKTAGVPIDKYWYTKLASPKVNGLDHFWDILEIEARQFYKASTIDVEVNTYRDRYQQTGAIKTEIFVIGISIIGEAQIANINLTDFINNAKRLPIFVKGQYCQTKLSNNRDEPVELFGAKWEVRQMTPY
jgi:hypothetical protein